MPGSNISMSLLPLTNEPTPTAVDNDQGSLSNTRTTSEQSTAEQAEKDCFFKVIDISMDTSELTVHGETYSREDVDDCIANIQPQSSNSVRIFLDGRGNVESYEPKVYGDAYPSCHPVVNEVELPKCNYYPPIEAQRKSRPYYLPALLTLWDHEMEPTFYEISVCYKHDSFVHGYSTSTSEYKHTPVQLMFFRDHEGKTMMICRGPGARIDLAKYRQTPCTNGSWRWLAEIEELLYRKLLDQGRTYSDQDNLLQLISLEILIENYNLITFHLLELQDDLKKNWLSSEDKLLRTTDLRKAIHKLENVFDAINCISNHIRDTPSTHAQGEHWSLLEKQVKAAELDFTYYSKRVDQLKIEHDHRQAVLSQIAGTKQSAGVTQLTALATFFLPLSLSAAILSMQTRFSDLGPLIYDFVGVVSILTIIAILLLLIHRYGKAFVEGVVETFYPTVAEHEIISRAFRYAGVGLWCLAFVVSFSVGMMVQIKLGWKTLGFSVAGITALGFIMMIAVRKFPLVAFCVECCEGDDDDDDNCWCCSCD
ncbi:hypothetical protein BS50DRAFT_673587 [Corynespora cassiicola Philippines]|uniref:Uncharacterized protein n=1 Tax=Corynespora cassiicola Philippines TaxID=1448308 RepID=A0A2T2NZN5_CORCC|nr:hypothetical protein BS50DRAFT_673587 [Corynespora cassiicola Philippines]